MELRQLQCFLAVAENGSVAKAAAELGIPQPAMNRAVRQLEKTLHTQLLYRYGRGVRLTEQGAKFQATITPLIRSLLRAGDHLQALTRRTSPGS